jgi:hypothetical protein
MRSVFAPGGEALLEGRAPEAGVAGTKGSPSGKGTSMNDDERPAETAQSEPEAADAARAAALAEAARARHERRREADRNEVFNDVYKSVEDIRSEWREAVRRQWLWALGLALTVLGGLVVPVVWVLGLIPVIFLAMSWESARERKRAYERVTFESDLEQKILAHEAAKQADLLSHEPPREGG